MPERYYASRDDAGAPTVIDWEGERPQESLPGSTMWEAKRIAAHLNGHHDKRPNPRCDLCKNRTTP